jgi:hypothetical protein
MQLSASLYRYLVTGIRTTTRSLYSTVHLECIRGCHPRTQEFPQHVIWLESSCSSAQLISSTRNGGKGMFQNKKWVRMMFHLNGLSPNRVT